MKTWSQTGMCNGLDLHTLCPYPLRTRPSNPPAVASELIASSTKATGTKIDVVLPAWFRGWPRFVGLWGLDGSAGTTAIIRGGPKAEPGNFREQPTRPQGWRTEGWI